MSVVCELAQAPGAHEPLFLLERLAHIRCYCLTVSGGPGVRISAATATVRGSEIDFRCSYEQPHAQASLFSLPGPAPPVESRLRLDVGEALVAGSGPCEVSDGFAYLRLDLDAGPAAANASRAIASENLGLSEARQLREDAGLYRRAAAQRRLERAALRGADLACRGCGAALLGVGSARALPDADASSLVDFMQCCQDIGFDWACAFPPVAAEHRPAAMSDEPSPPAWPDDRPTCFIGGHTLLLRAPLDDAAPLRQRVSLDLAARFDEPPCYRHASAAVGVWAPIRCARCSAALGASRLGSAAAAAAAAAEVGAPAAAPAGSRGQAPLWFAGGAPAELDCSLQLLKSRIDLTPLPVPAGADGPGGSGAAAAAQAAAQVAEQPLRVYSIAAAVAGCMLDACEEEGGEHARHFELAASPARPRALGPGASAEWALRTAGGFWQASPPSLRLVLLSPYVTLATNDPALGGAHRGGPVSDALKVLYGPAGQNEPTADLAGGAPAGAVGGAVAARALVLPAAEDRAQIERALSESTAALPPAARRVGQLQVGYLPVVATWD